MSRGKRVGGQRGREGGRDEPRPDVAGPLDPDGRGVTADTALRLSRYLGTTPEFWLNLQKTFGLRVAENEAGKRIARRRR